VARTVTVAGTVAADVVPLASVTTVSLAAAAGSVTVPVTVVPSPPVTLVGLTVTLVRGVRTLNVVVLLAEPIDAVIVTEAVAFTTRWVTAKVPVVAPAATVTVAGTVAADVVSLARVTTVPPVGAAAGSVTVPVTVVPSPPVTAVGLTVTLVIGDCTVSVVVLVTPL
jgi:hypothetical protein